MSRVLFIIDHKIQDYMILCPVITSENQFFPDHLSFQLPLFIDKWVKVFLTLKWSRNLYLEKKISSSLLLVTL